MFTGAMPKPVVAQVQRLLDLDSAREVYVCCSGSFRVEQMLRQAAPRARVVSNDVSLVSCMLGTLAATGEVPAVTFRGALAWMEEATSNEPIDRIAAVFVAWQMSRFTGKSEYAALHHLHYRVDFGRYHAKVKENVRQLLGTLRVDAFNAVDFRVHAREGIERGATVIAFPPTYRGGYERMYRFLDANISWAAPNYDVFDPATVGTWIASLDAGGHPYAVVADQKLPGLRVGASFTPACNKAIHIYASGGRSTLSRVRRPTQAFAFRPVSQADLVAGATVAVVPATTKQMDFLKDRYLAKGITHAKGLLNFLVYIGGALAGGFIYARSTSHPERDLYLLSDFSVTREARVAKLIALIATSRLTIGIAERKMVTRFGYIATTVFTDKPASMKYRGAFKLRARGNGFLQYESVPRAQTPQEIYDDWHHKHFRATADQGHAGAPR